jgi:hypothetical protein
MYRNLVIVACGDNSLHSDWLLGDKNFDFGFIYYGDSDEKFEEYKKQSKYNLKKKGQKWHLIYDFIKIFEDEIKKYDYIWFPDDDLKTDFDSINRLFNINTDFKLNLSQPTLDGYVSFDIERRIDESILRFTDFVEIICPIMNIKTVFKLLDTFIYNDSGWGLDFLWPKILGYPENKIAIIDDVTVTHTRPVSGDYSRFKKKPMDELTELFQKYGLVWRQTVLNTIKK